MCDLRITRQSDFDSAWDSFSRTVTSHGNTRPTATSNNIGDETVLSAVSGPNNALMAPAAKIVDKSSTVIESKVQMGKSTQSSTESQRSNDPRRKVKLKEIPRNVPPGPLLRRAVTATVREAVTGIYMHLINTAILI